MKEVSYFKLIIFSFLISFAELANAQFTESKPFIMVRNSASAWGDYNNDGNLDVIIAGYTDKETLTKIYKNNGDGTFTQLADNLAGVKNCDAAWGDYDNDGDLDVIIGGVNGTNKITKIYKNNNGSFVEQTSITLPGVEEGSFAWGDYDNDGDLDLLITGNTGTLYTPITKIYRNNGNETFTEQTSISLTGISYGKALWGDYNNDGFPDIFMSGDGFTKIYKNNRNNTFTEQQTLFIGLSLSDITLGDYDNDGFLDVLLTGSDNNVSTSKLYHNEGNGSFVEETGQSFAGVREPNGSFVDYNNDGYLDIVLVGYNLSMNDYLFKIYRNNGNRTFTEITIPALLFGVESGSAVWGDYDNDGDVDMQITGFTGRYNGTTSQPILLGSIYKNTSIEKTPKNTNVAPSVITNLKSIVTGGDVVLSWDIGVDTETPSKGLTYNLYVYNELKTDTFIVAPMAYKQSHPSNGLRLSARQGNVQYSANGYILKNLVSGNYKWSVQAVDAGLKGGPFAVEASFSVTNALADVKINLIDKTLTHTNSTMQYSITSTTGADGTWLNCTDRTTDVDYGNGGFDIWVRWKNNTSVFIKAGTLSFKSATPSYSIDYFNETTNETVSSTVLYSLNSNMSDAKAGSQEKVPLTPGKNVYFKVKATENTFESEIQTLTVPARPATPKYTLDSLSYQTKQVLVSADEYSKSINMANAISGSGTTVPVEVGKTIYIRTKATNSSFASGVEALNFPILWERKNTTLNGVSSSSLDLGDYNNDGFLDLVMEGDSIRNADNSFTQISKLYANTGNSFVEQKSVKLEKVSSGSIKWGDYNSDGYLDILLTGEFKTKIYKNNGDGTFTEQTNIVLPGMTSCTAMWGDYNNDGYDDILLSGYTSSTENSTDIYRNNGDNSFSRYADTTFAKFGKYAQWADLDNDGDLDIAISSYNSSKSNAAIYRNNGDGSFSKMNTQLKGTVYGDLEFGDYDNDGDLDIILAGSLNGQSSIPELYENKGNFTFTAKSMLNWGSSPAVCKWGDYNNDGKLEILYRDIVLKNYGTTFGKDSIVSFNGGYWGDNIWGDLNGDKNLDAIGTGYDYADYNRNTRFTKVYINCSVQKNTAPTAPAGLVAKVSGNTVILKWNRATDQETPTRSLSYNFQVNQTSGNPDYKPFNILPKADESTGTRRIVGLGNAQLDTSWVIKNVPVGTYNWKVQAIDNAYIGGVFSNTAQFTVEAFPAQAANVTVTSITKSSASIKWTNGGGTARAVFIKLNGVGLLPLPINKVTYSANPAFGSGSQIEKEGWFCVYNGTDNQVNVTGLTQNSRYKVLVCEYNGSSGSEIYAGSVAGTNAAEFKTLDSGTGLQETAYIHSIYPNPASDYIIVTTSGSDSATIQLITLNGVVVLKKEITNSTEQLNLTSFPRGAYFIKLQTKNKVEVKKIILE